MKPSEQAAAGEALVHITTPGAWRAALAVGSLVAPSLVTEGFIHLSRPDQVSGVANYWFAARDELLMLVIDPRRLPDPGAIVVADTADGRFPHLHAALPTRAVTSVLVYRPTASGLFEDQALPSPDDLVARARAFERSFSERRAAAVVPVVGGVAVLDPRVPNSYMHNRLLIDDEIDASTVAAEADRVMGGHSHRRAEFARYPPGGLDWPVEEERLLVLKPESAAPEVTVPVVAVTPEVMAGLWRPDWHRELEGVSEEVVEQLIAREPLSDVCVKVDNLAVLGPDGIPVAGAQLLVDGATAAIDAVVTAPEVRRRGLGRALVAEAIRRARLQGCDCIFLRAMGNDWPRHWYERLGFVDVGVAWVATKEL